MILTPVDHTNRLFAISDVIDPSLCEELQSIDWTQIPSKKDPYWKEGSKLQRHVLESDSIPQQTAVDRAIESSLDLVNQVTGRNYKGVGISWYLCEPGYRCLLHTDGQQPNSMLFYIVMPGPDYGTTFYWTKDTSDLRHKFLGIPGTGYFVINENDRGDIQGNWHDADPPTPGYPYRVLLHCRFYK